MIVSDSTLCVVDKDKARRASAGSRFGDGSRMLVPKFSVLGFGFRGLGVWVVQGLGFRSRV